MSESLPRITIPPKQWVDVYALTGLTVGEQLSIQNKGRDQAELSESVDAPLSTTGRNNVLVDEFLNSSKSPVGCWAYSRLGTKLQVDLYGISGFKPFKENDPATDFSVEVALGNVPGFSTAAVVMNNPSADNSDFFDVWSGGGNMIMPTTAETWTIESDSALDTNLTGTGAWNVIIQSLDDDYNIQAPQFPELNGLTPVDIGGTHYRTHQLSATSGMLVLTAGSTRRNQGTLTVKDKATGDIRMTIQPLAGKSEDGHIAIPAGQTLLVLTDINPWDKDESGVINIELTASTPNAATIRTGSFPGYQNDLTIVFNAKFKLPEKTDLILIAKPTNNGATVRFVQEFYVIDNAIVGI